jgi:hypothetical protein
VDAAWAERPNLPVRRQDALSACETAMDRRDADRAREVLAMNRRPGGGSRGAFLFGWGPAQGSGAEDAPILSLDLSRVTACERASAADGGRAAADRDHPPDFCATGCKSRLSGARFATGPIRWVRPSSS